MKTKIRFALLLLVAVTLAFGNISPSLAEEEVPPADSAADIVTIQRVLDLWSGSNSSYISGMTVYGNALFFGADRNNGIGRELWIYDVENSPVAYDVNLGAGDSLPQDLAVYNGALYFQADGGDGAGNELWKFDWTNGAQRVADIRNGANSSYPADLTAYGTSLFFSAIGDNGVGRELWIYDPANPGTPLAYDINPGAASSSPSNMAVFNGSLYFSADGGDGAGRELWKFDWTNGAQRVADINSGSEHSSVGDLTVYNGALYFGATENKAGRELWSYDEINGTQLVADIWSGVGSSSIRYLEVYNGALYFTANGNDLAGQELWKYDSTNGAQRVTDICSGTCSSSPWFMTVYKNALYFSANGNDGAGEELWKYDNTAVASFRPAKSYDGWILESDEFANIGGTINSSATTFNLGDNAQNKQYRSILSFNTSTLPDSAVIISATLKIRKQGLSGTNPFTTHENIAVDIIKGAFSGNNALQAVDFQAAPNKLAVGFFKNLPDVNNWFTSILGKTAYPFINPLGVTQFRLRFQKDDNNDNGADFLRFFSADSANMSDYPTLEVKYYIP